MGRQLRPRRGIALAAALCVLGLISTPAFAAAHWVVGHYGPEGRWHPGHWVGGYGPPPGPNEGPPPGIAAAGRVWVPGHFNGQHWVQGHWAAR